MLAGVMVKAAFCDPTIPSAVTREARYPVQQGLPFNLAPLMLDYVSDNSHTKFPLFNIKNTTHYYGILISQNNDILTCTAYEEYNGTVQPYTTLYTTTISGASTPAYIFIFFEWETDSTDSATIFAVKPDCKRYECPVHVGEYNSEPALIGSTSGTKRDVSTYPLGEEPTRPYVTGTFAFTPSLYGKAPSMMIDVYDNVSAGIVAFGGGVTGISAFETDICSSDGTTPEEYEPSTEPPFEPSEPGPYNPDPDDSSDEIPLPDDPDIGVTEVGFINVYAPSKLGLQNFGSEIFPNVGSATDIVDALSKLATVLMNQNLIDYVIDCHVVPVLPLVSGIDYIRVGFRQTTIQAPVVRSDYVNVSCGSLNIPEFFGGFQDYITKGKIYLPFIGFVDTKPEFYQAGTISIDYKFNIIDGSFMAYIRSTSSKSNLASSVIAQYGGNACMHFPLTGVNYANMISGVIGGAISMASAENPAAVMGGASSISNAISRGGSVQQSNGYNSTSALLGVRKPYLMIERPVPAYPANYAHDNGYPSNITTLLTNVSGYTEIEDIDLSGIPLTEGELNELRSLLKEGVYF